MTIPLDASDPYEVGPYRLCGRVGVGGMGVVYRAVARDGRSVAVKLPHEGVASDPVLRAQFAQEVSAALRVRGRFVAQALDADPAAVRPWLATEYVDGLNLADTVSIRGPLLEGALIGLAAGLAHALVAIHSAGVVHNDLNPANIILAWDGPKVVDFGAATTVATAGTAGTAGTPPTGSVAGSAAGPASRGIPGGTAAWMAPERISGEPAAAPADVFAWAGCVVLAATGSHPFAADSAGATVARILFGEPDVTGVPESLAHPVRRALSKTPAARPTPVELVASLIAGLVPPSPAPR